MAVNGAVAREPGTLADPLTDIVTVDGRLLPAREPLHYVLLNKPAGYVTSGTIPGTGSRHRSGARAGPLYPVGRLDYDVEGALLLTNDGPLTHRLLHPRYRIARVYEASVRGRVEGGRSGPLASRRDPRRRAGVSPAVELVQRAARRASSAYPSPRGAPTRSSATRRPWATGCFTCGGWPSGRSSSAPCPEGAADLSGRAEIRALARAAVAEGRPPR